MILPADVQAALDWIQRCPCLDPLECKLCEPAVEMLQDGGVGVLYAYHDLMSELDLMDLPLPLAHRMSHFADVVAQRIEYAALYGTPTEFQMEMP